MGDNNELPVTESIPERLREATRNLLIISLEHWQLDARVTDTPDGFDLVGPNDTVQIKRAADQLPFQWIALANGRRRTAASVTGLLTILRTHWNQSGVPANIATHRLRMGAQPSTPRSTAQ